MEKFDLEKLSQEYGDRGQEKELDPELIKVAKNVIDCYDFKPEKESFLVVTDTKVMDLNPDFLLAVEKQLKETTEANPRSKGNYEILTVPTSEYSATEFGDYVGDKLKNRPVLIVTSMSRSHSKETAAAYQGHIPPKENFDKLLESENLAAGLASISENSDYYEKLKDLARKKRSRIISMTKGHNPYEILTKGAVQESPENLRERGDKLVEMMKNVDSVKISTPNGTNLSLKPRIDKSIVEDGRITMPGDMANYPIGEWSCSVKLEGTSGRLVVDIAAGGNHNKDQFDAHGPIALDIEDGVVEAINDFDLAELKELLSKETDYELLDKNDSSDKDLKQKQIAERKRIQDFVDKYFDEKNVDNPLMRSMLKYWIAGDTIRHDNFRLAEFAMGTNAMACKDKDPKDIGSSEGEKIYGTTHIAVGSNGAFGIDKNDPDFNDCQIHCDMVISGASIECTNKDKSKFEVLKDGQPINY